MQDGERTRERKPRTRGNVDIGAERPAPPGISKIAYVFVGILCLAIVGVAGTLAYGAEYRRAEETRLRELAAIGSLKAGQIESWRRGFYEIAQIAARSPLLAKAVRQASEGRASAGDIALLAERLRLFVEYDACDGAALYATGGSFIASGSPDKDDFPDDSLDEASRAIAVRVLASGRAEFRDVYRRPDGRFGLDLIVPVIDMDGKGVGILVMRKDPDHELYPLLASWPVPCDSAETLLARREGDVVLFINRLKFGDEEPLSLRMPVSARDLPAAAAVLGTTGSFEGVDYRGEPVVAELRHIAESPWYIVAKMDKSEAMAEATQRGMTVIAGMIGACLLAMALIVFVFNRKKGALYGALYREERRRAELNAEFSATLFGIGDGVISTDAAGRVRWLNAAAERMTGWTGAEARGRSLGDVFRVRSAATGISVPDSAEAVMLSGGRVDLPGGTVLESRDGTELSIADSGAPIRDARGAIDGAVIVFRDVSAERRAEEQSARLSAIIEGSLNEVLVMDAETLRFSYANRAALANLGYTTEELSSMTLMDIKPELTPARLAELLEPLRSGRGGSATLAAVNRRKDGSTYEVFLSVQAVGSGADRSFVSIGLDFSERTRLERELEERLAERETLLRELHHRTKNNLQVVGSLLSIEAGELEDEKSRAALRDMGRRVETMAMAHELIYKSDSLSRIELGPYLRDIAALAIEGAGPSRRIELEFGSPRIEAAIETASPLGIVVNELVTNSIKHGFRDGRGGKIRLSLERSGGGPLALKYADDGEGLPPDFDPDRAGHIGMILIQSLVKGQLRGTMSYAGEGGFSCELSFMPPSREADPDEA
jgi:PAS domain S-box-containing protein